MQRIVAALDLAKCCVTLSPTLLIFMKISPYILLSLTSLFWSLNFIIGKIVSDVIPPNSVSFLRWLLPFLLFLPLNWKEIKIHKAIFLNRWGLILLLGATGYCLNSIGVYEAVRFTTTINTSVINAFNPVLIAVAGYLLYRERITKFQLLGFILSLTGVLCIIFQGKWKLLLDLRSNVGDLFMLGSISVFSVHAVVYRQKAPGFPERPMFPLMMLGGLLVTLPLVLLEGQAYHWAWIGQLKAIHVVGILCLNIFPSVLAYRFWNSALRKVSANKVGIFLYLVPVYTTIISVLFLKERLRLFQIFGGLLIFAGVMLVTRGAFIRRTSEAAKQ
jgi:drug/metabolite transporter (DMT)-like permease